MSGVVWHDIECGRYTQDLQLWRELAEQYVGEGESLLDVGAGTGRVSLELARAGYTVVALDLDEELLLELGRRAHDEDLDVETVRADARSFSLPGQRFSLIAVPMQTIQLLEGHDGRRAFLRRAREHAKDGAMVAVAIAMEEDFEEFQWHEGDPSPLPDIAEYGGQSYFSQPTAVRRIAGGFVLERRREQVDSAGARSVSQDSVTLDIVSVDDLHVSGLEAGLRPSRIHEIPPTDEHIGSQVVMFTV